MKTLLGRGAEPLHEQQGKTTPQTKGKRKPETLEIEGETNGGNRKVEAIHRRWMLLRKKERGGEEGGGEKEF